MDRSILKDNQPDHKIIKSKKQKKGRMTMLSETINNHASQDRETSMSSVTEGSEDEEEGEGGSSSESNSENDSNSDDESSVGSDKDARGSGNEVGSSGGGGHMIQQRKGKSWGASNPLGAFLCFLK